MKAFALVFILQVLACLPLQAARVVGVLLGKLSLWTGSRMLNTTHANLELCFSDMNESQRRLLAKHSVEHTFMTIAEAGALWLWAPDKALALIRQVDGLELMLEAYSRGKGVIVLAPHLGNWELVGLYVLSKLENIIDRQLLGLYRDDGLAVVNLPGQQV